MPDRIILLTSEFPPGPGGIGNHAWNLAKHLVQKGYKVTVCADIRKAFISETKAFDEQQPFEVIRNRRDLGTLIGILHRSINFFRLQLSARKGTLLVATGKFPLWVTALFKTLRPGIPIMAVVHGSEVNFPSGWKKALTNASLKKYDKLIAVSNFTSGIVRELVTDSDVVVIPNGFDHARINAFNSNGKLSGDPALVTVGTLSPRKGQHNVIQALPKVIQAFPGVKYHMVGIPSQQKELVLQAEELAVNKQIIFHGAVTDEKLVHAPKGSALFLMLSDTQGDGDIEGFGIAILEANACGIPAIGSKGCGIEDAIGDTYSGRLINPKDSEAVADAIKEVMNNYDQYRTNAILWAREFTWEQVIIKYIREIEK